MFTAHLINDKKEVLCQLQSKERIVLQWIKNSFKAAQNDHAELGRPLTFRVHDGKHASILS